MDAIGCDGEDEEQGLKRCKSCIGSYHKGGCRTRHEDRLPEILDEAGHRQSGRLRFSRSRSRSSYREG